MWEVLVIVLGAAVGASLAPLRGTWFRVGVTAGSALVVGVIVAAVSGELAESPAYALWDAAQAIAAALLTQAIVVRLRRPHTAGG
jgi:hypothetical protein